MDVLLDSYVAQGTSHKVCEDYAELTSNTGFGALCDGCSSAKWTDLGARLMSKMILSNVNFYAESKANRITLLKEFIEKTAIRKEELTDAFHVTALTFLRSSIHVVGDGAIYFECQEEGEDLYYHEILIDYPFSNAPWYPVYDTNKLMADNYVNYFGIENRKRIKYKFYDKDWKSFEEGEYFVDADKDVQFPIETNVKRFIMASDGIESFTTREPCADVELSIEPYHIAQEVFKISHESNTMLQRKMNVLNKKFKKQEWEHYDDLSMIFGVIRSHE